MYIRVAIYTVKFPFFSMCSVNAVLILVTRCTDPLPLSVDWDLILAYFIAMHTNRMFILHLGFI